MAEGDVIVFTTFPADRFSAAEVLRWYRVRWQVELTFKRFKSLARLGHLPKRTDDSALAWLYGKLLVALLAEKLAHRAGRAPFPPAERADERSRSTLAGVHAESAGIDAETRRIRRSAGRRDANSAAGADNDSPRPEIATRSDLP